jgi:hypothetical protein
MCLLLLAAWRVQKIDCCDGLYTFQLARWVCEVSQLYTEGASFQLLMPLAGWPRLPAQPARVETTWII